MNESLIYIDQYFNGELLPVEKTLFEERCLADPAFAREVANYIMMRDQAKDQWVQQKKRDFAELDESKNTITTLAKKEKFATVRKISAWRQLAIAAVTVGILVLGIVVYLQFIKNDKSGLVINKKEDLLKGRNHSDTTQKKSLIDSDQLDKSKEIPEREISIQLTEQLVAKNFKPDPLPENTEGVLAEAFNEYKEGDYKSASREYEDAIVLVEELDTRSGVDEKEAQEKQLLLFYAHYYNGMSNLAIGNTGKAIAELKKIRKSPTRFWQDKITWYTALAYLKQGNVKDAQSLLKAVVESKHSGAYKQKALTLLGDLE